MHRLNFLTQSLFAYGEFWKSKSFFDVQATEVFDRFLRFSESPEDIYHRKNFSGHLTGSAVVISRDSKLVLLNFHKKLQRWLQFGGHADGERDPLKVAIKETQEEAGLQNPEILTLTDYPQDMLKAQNYLDLQFAPICPLDIDIHPIPQIGAEKGHLHYDIRYLLRNYDGEAAYSSVESEKIEWFTLDEALEQAEESSLKRMIEKVKWLRSSGLI